jgi:hypothetical protein
VEEKSSLKSLSNSELLLNKEIKNDTFPYQYFVELSAPWHKNGMNVFASILGELVKVKWKQSMSANFLSTNQISDAKHDIYEYISDLIEILGCESQGSRFSRIGGD